MIAANELRIGNYIYWNIPEKLNTFHEVVGIRNGKPQTIPISLGESILDYLPISLTPEILEKCGFEWSIYHQAWHKQGFVFDLSERSVGGFFMHKSRLNSEIICPKIQYLHQLQNLYFALTNEELNYTP